MICVTIAKETNQSLRESWQRAALSGAKLAELRLDYLTEPVDWALLLRDRPTSVLITVRRTIDGGRWAGDESHRRQLLSEASQNGADWIDVEVDIAREFPRAGISRRVVSFHDMTSTPEELSKIARECSEGDADLVKLAVMARSLRDSFRLLDTIRQSHNDRPTMGLAMGPLGQFTRVAKARFGTNWTYAAWESDTPPAPGMLAFSELRSIYDYESINHDTQLYAVIGDPVGHSKSPLVHNAAFRHHGLNKSYVPVRVPPEELAWFLQICGDYGFRGISVTIPHKEAVIAPLAESCPLVRLTGSCNTVMIEPEKSGHFFRLGGYNTDLDAALGSLQEALPTEQNGSPATLSGVKVLLLGAGGVARSLAFGLKRAGADLTIVNRTAERAESLAAETGASSARWDDREKLARDSAILINGTSLGMSPHVELSPLGPDCFHPGQVVFDTIYIPEWTVFLKSARAAGARTLSGVDMFIRQAAIQSRLFSGGAEPPVSLMAEKLRAALSPAS
ncbi:MAG: shikimate dehydrogenase [Isosphaeraceae bacterium]